MCLEHYFTDDVYPFINLFDCCSISKADDKFGAEFEMVIHATVLFDLSNLLKGCGSPFA